MPLSDAVWTIPNLLTLIRIALTPAFIAAFAGEWFSVAWILFAVAAFTDGLDGFLARVMNQRSRLGAILDPLADKLLLDSSFIVLAAKGWLPAALAVVVVSRDVIIIGGLFLMQFLGVDVRQRIKPTLTSKINTLLQIILVLMVLLERTFAWQWDNLRLATVVLVVGLTLVSGVQYVRRGFAIMEEERREKEAKGKEQ